MKTMKKNILALMLTLICVFSANATETTWFWKSKTPWQKMLIVLNKHGIDTVGITVFTPLKMSVWSELSADLNNEFSVKKGVVWPNDDEVFVGDVICLYMQEKYCDDKGEKYDYYRIRYSTSEKDYSIFVDKYPESKYVEEMQKKEICVKAFFSWIYEIETDRGCHRSYNRSLDVNNCPYEGFELLVSVIKRYMKTVEAWDAVRSRREKGYTDCDIFVTFKEENQDYLSGYAAFIDDSISQCRHNNAWKTACNANTITAYREYLAAYPDGEHADIVKKKIRDYQDWMDAREKDTYVAYKKYCALHPYGDSIHAANAIILKKKNFEWERIKNSKDWNVFIDFREQYDEYIVEGRDLAFEAMGEIEKRDWNRAKRVNTWKSLSDFQEKYPYGYYYDDADELKYNILSKNQSSDIRTDDFEAIGMCSSPDSCVVIVGNISGRNTLYCVTLTGSNGGRKYYGTARMGQVTALKVPNGEYKIMIECKGVESHHGDIVVSGKVYGAVYCIKNIYGTDDCSEEAMKKVKRACEKIADSNAKIFWNQR